jgi:hypothetical protein
MIILSKMEEAYQAIVYGYNEPNVAWMHPLTIQDFLDTMNHNGHHGQPEYLQFNNARIKSSSSMPVGEVEFGYEPTNLPEKFGQPPRVNKRVPEYQYRDRRSRARIVADAQS